MQRDRLELMGKPHIGDTLYVGKHAFDATLLDGALCEICGRVATNSHHIVPKGAGGGSRTVVRNGVAMRSPCIAVCGCGNSSGCHKALHDGSVKIRWEWDVPKFAEDYESGALDIRPHSERFFDYGSYIIVFANGYARRYRR